MQTHNLGYPRIGARRELKKACENFWAGKISEPQLLEEAKAIRAYNWKLQKEAGVSIIPSNDFSLYDQVLDCSLMVGNIPARYKPLQTGEKHSLLQLYFAMARGDAKLDITALEMTKWFDTNYHYLVPEFVSNQSFNLLNNKVLEEFNEAKNLGIHTKPVVLGPVSYLMLGKEKSEGFHRLELLDNLLPVYAQLLESLAEAGVSWMQMDEPCLVTDLNTIEKEAFRKAYHQLAKISPKLRIILTTYFGELGDNLSLATSLPVAALHVDLARCPHQLNAVLEGIKHPMLLSLGIIDGRNVWKNDYRKSVELIRCAVDKLGQERVMLAPSCALLHVPCDLSLEEDETTLPAEVRQWMAFARQKLNELSVLAKLSASNAEEGTLLSQAIKDSDQVVLSRSTSEIVHDLSVKLRWQEFGGAVHKRIQSFDQRKPLQQAHLQLPLFPTTTIGSFPQTKEVRGFRAKLKKGEITVSDYEKSMTDEIARVIQIQEDLGLDVLVHGEFERNDMVEYFGERLKGFAFTQYGWVQSYGSRCVKPPVVYGDVSRPREMTVKWTSYAQSLTQKPVKGMLTGPVTILQWSFVRDDQPRFETAGQIALAIRDEVLDLEQAGIKIIQVDEPALREGLPLREKDQADYLKWAVNNFLLATRDVKPETQIHTHMCYAEFNDIMASILDMDADVITIETSRSQMELLNAFHSFEYPNDIGPGVYDIHSPRIPTVEEIIQLLNRAAQVINVHQLWVNPDCGLKTRGWKETSEALRNMVLAAQKQRALQALCLD